MVMLSVRAVEDVALDPGALWPPRGVAVPAVGEVLRSVDDGGQGLVVFLRNSAVISVSSVVVTLGVSILGAYAIASWSRASPAAPRRADPTVRRRTVRPGWCR